MEGFERAGRLTRPYSCGGHADTRTASNVPIATRLSATAEYRWWCSFIELSRDRKDCLCFLQYFGGLHLNTVFFRTRISSESKLKGFRSPFYKCI